MTGFMHEKEFSRKNFLKGSGAVVVGASVVGAGLAGKASAAARPTLAGYNADPAQIDSWFVVNADNTIILRQTKMETGNGITTGFLQVVAAVLPLTYAYDGLERVTTTGFDSTALRDLTAVIGATLLALALGATTLRRRTP